MDGDAADVVAQQLALAGVQPHPDLQTQLPQPGPDGVGRPDGPGRPVEGGQEPVPGGLDLPAPVPGQLPADRLLVLHQQVVPAAVPQAGRPAGRVDDVGEQHRCQHPVGVDGRPGPGQELLGQLDDGVLVAEEREVGVAGQLHEPGAGDALGHVAAGPDVGRPVAGPVQHQHGGLDRTEQPADVHRAEGPDPLVLLRRTWPPRRGTSGPSAQRTASAASRGATISRNWAPSSNAPLPSSSPAGPRAPRRSSPTGSPRRGGWPGATRR